MLKIQDNDVPEVITGRSSTPSSPQPLNLDKLRAAKENSNLMFEAVRKRTQSINNNLLLLDISTVLLTIIIRSEAHEYTLGNILRRLQAITRENTDVAELLSVECKVPKAESFKPDTRAIRDATAHVRFESYLLLAILQFILKIPRMAIHLREHTQERNFWTFMKTMTE